MTAAVLLVPRAVFATTRAVVPAKGVLWTIPLVAGLLNWATTRSIHKIKREIRKMLNRETDSNGEATATQRFDDSDKRYNEYYTANWVLFFAMLGVGGGTYFRRNNI